PDTRADIMGTHPADRRRPAMVTAALDAQRRILNRLKRASGQLTAVIDDVDGRGNCRDVVTQLSAVSSDIDQPGYDIISTAMKDCLVDPGAAEPQGGVTPEELEKLSMMLA